VLTSRNLFSGITFQKVGKNKCSLHLFVSPQVKVYKAGVAE
jgi:hypothetical protein